MSHVIAAVSTGWQISAIGILRLSGDGAIAVADRVFQGVFRRTAGGHAAPTVWCWAICGIPRAGC